MDNLQGSTKQELQKKFSDKFGDIEIFSEEHKKDIDRFASLLGSMKGGEGDKTSIPALKSNLAEFQSYLQQNRIVLTNAEKREISAVSGSGHPPAVKKRMMEDLIHSIKNRHQRELKAAKEKERFEDEIKELEKRGSGIVNWFRLFRFSIEYGTISPFAHRLKNHSLNIIKKSCDSWYSILVKDLSEVLSSDYYKYSNLEYNALRALYDLGEGLSVVKETGDVPYYYFHEIQPEIESFARFYIPVISNSEIIEKALKKLTGTRQTEHGFFGAFKDITGQPLFNNLPVKFTDFEFYTKTVTGTLLSFYSIKEGVVLKSVNQLKYILDENGELDSDIKKLTPDAQIVETKSREKSSDEDDTDSKRLKELDHVVNYYIPKGIELNKQYLPKDGIFSAGKKPDGSVKPFVRYKNLIEFFIKTFVDPLYRENEFILMYDMNEYRNYIDIKPELQNIISKFTYQDIGFSGTKFREITDLAISKDKDPAGYIETLFSLETRKNLVSEKEKTAIEIFSNISTLCYRLATVLKELIDYYYKNREINHEDVRLNFDFYMNAEVKFSKALKGSRFFEQNIITLRTFLESACSFAFFIANELMNPYVKSMNDEFLSLKNAIEGRKKEGEQTQVKLETDFSGLSSDEEVIENELERSLDRIYSDPVSGLMKKEYFDDQILNKYYDSENKYKLRNTRYVFFCSVDNLKEINTEQGHKTGDRVLGFAVETLRGNMNSAGKDSGNVLIRYEGADMIGYLNNISFSEALDIFKMSQMLLNTSSVKTGSGQVDSVSFSAGIYHERSGTNVYDNIKASKALMLKARSKGGANIAFVKDSERILTENDFNRFGEVDEDIISYLI